MADTAPGAPAADAPPAVNRDELTAFLADSSLPAPDVSRCVNNIINANVTNLNMLRDVSVALGADGIAVASAVWAAEPPKLRTMAVGLLCNWLTRQFIAGEFDTEAG